MNLEVTYLFLTSPSGEDFYIYQFPEGLGMIKVLALGIRMQNNPQTRAEIFRVHGFSWSYVVPKSNLHPRVEISLMTSLTPKSSI